MVLAQQAVVGSLLRAVGVATARIARDAATKSFENIVKELRVDRVSEEISPAADRYGFYTLIPRRKEDKVSYGKSNLRRNELPYKHLVQSSITWHFHALRK